MTVNPIIPQKGNPSQVSGAQSQSGEEAFQRDFSKSDGYSKESLDKAVSERTRISRTQGGQKTRRARAALPVIHGEETLTDEPVYRTVMVDGIMHTLRLIAIA